MRAIIEASPREELGQFEHQMKIIAGSVIRILRNLTRRTKNRVADVRIQRLRSTALKRARREFSDGKFIGPYERYGSVAGFYEEQWLWSQRSRIKGVVLDMSTP